MFLRLEEKGIYEKLWYNFLAFKSYSIKIFLILFHCIHKLLFRFTEFYLYGVLIIIVDLRITTTAKTNQQKCIAIYIFQKN